MAQVQLTFAPVVKRVAPAVVNVYARSVVQAPVNPFFTDPLFRAVLRRRPQMRQRVQQSLGSGVIVRADGIDPDQQPRRPGRHGHRRGALRQARVQGQGRCSPIRAPISRCSRSTRKGETACRRLPFADSDKVQVGDLVLAVGDPFGVGQTVTMGIVSALARTQVSASRLSVLHPDRRRDQSGQFRRRAGDDGRQARRHQHLHRVELRRLDRHRLRDPGQPGAAHPRRRAAAAA